MPILEALFDKTLDLRVGDIEERSNVVRIVANNAIAKLKDVQTTPPLRSVRADQMVHISGSLIR
jgi:hypothetical protein